MLREGRLLVGETRKGISTAYAHGIHKYFQFSARVLLDLEDSEPAQHVCVRDTR